ncbi:nuclease-related domain-containing protein [Planococcus sp. N028]|uniref:Nuclease-related domain-containing protein n=1 Tax=Planococcus shixiaomingii TaxID=3058393 RepID=A0ABT8N2U4_9BACL|nr:nuclease-related domain-containing protein [Planococcus sp. N028]
MNIVERKRPAILIYLEALLARTPSHRPEYPFLTEKVRRRTAGFAGESWFDKNWLHYETSEPFRVIPDFQISSHQMDALCIFPTFIAIIEIKNISGFIEMDHETRQLIRTKDGETIGMANPDDQLYRHEKKIQQLTNYKIPVIGIVVFTNSTSVLKVSNIKRKVIHLSGLPYTLDSLIEQYRTSPKFDVHQLCSLFLTCQSPIKPYNPEPIPYPLLTGVFCPDCTFSTMSYSRDFWRCPACRLKQRDAHLLALQDYRLLVGETISNREFRQFTELRSRTNATLLLKRSGFQTIDTHKSLHYIIPEMDLRDKRK